MRLQIGARDALIVVDVQEDFVTGSLAVPEARAIVPAVNRCAALFASRHAAVFASRDWHPADHVSFRSHGGAWPAHCVAGTSGARFARGLRLPRSARIVSKATLHDHEAYSAFDGTFLHDELRDHGIRRLFVCGLATDYCVRATVLDGCRLGYDVLVLEDAIRAVEPNGGAAAREDMRRAGARFVAIEALGAAPEHAHG